MLKQLNRLKKLTKYKAMSSGSFGYSSLSSSSSSSSNGSGNNNRRNYSNNNNNKSYNNNNSSNRGGRGGNRDHQQLLQNYHIQESKQIQSILEHSHSLFEKESIGFVDTHVHLEYMLQRLFKSEQVETLEQKEKALIKLLTCESGNEDFIKLLLKRLDAVVCIFCDPTSFSPSLGMYQDLIQMRALNVKVSFGLHPHNAKYYNEELQNRINDCIKHSGESCVAYGECGLDFHYNNSEPEIQKDCFIKQIHQAVSVLNLPLIVHTREADNDTLKILKENVPKDWKIHVHCFTDTPNFALQLIEHFPNLFIGFTGCCTYAKKEDQSYGSDDILKVVPLERILLETDGPYMPVKIKGGEVGKFRPIGHSGQVPMIAQHIANVKNVDVTEVLHNARINTMKMYGI
ncbi:hypothetical protein ABK040_010502 [Willaertia magna]